MLDLKLFSQRDSRWKDDQYGTSPSTIGKLGCATTAVSSILNYYGYSTDPKKLDDLLASNNGYHKGSYIIWQRVADLFPRVKFEGRFYSYSNSRAVDWLSRSVPVLVQVDGAPIGAAGQQHWVVFVGDQKAYDPWTGKLTPTSNWKPTGMAAYSGKPASSEEYVPKRDLEICIKEKDSNWQTYQKEVKAHKATKENLQKANTRIIKLEEEKTDLIDERNQAENKASKYQKEHTDFLDKLAAKMAVTSDAVAIESEIDLLISKEDKVTDLETKLKTEREKYEKTISDLKKEAGDLRIKVGELEDKIENLEKPEPELPPEPPRLREKIRNWIKDLVERLPLTHSE